MILSITKAGFDAGAAAAGLVGSDLATQSVAQGVQVQPLSMRGLRYLVWTLGLEVPNSDCLILLCNIQAGAAGKNTAWVQT